MNAKILKIFGDMEFIPPKAFAMLGSPMHKEQHKKLKKEQKRALDEKNLEKESEMESLRATKKNMDVVVSRRKLAGDQGW